MCGRFTLTRSAAEVAEHFGLEAAPVLVPRFNVAPTQPVLAIRAPLGTREAVQLHWGLVPFWAKHAGDAAKHINARVETLTERPAFREAAERRRCLVPADGFYEWRGARGERQPYHIALPQGELFAFAGLWERWRTPAGGALESLTIVTTAATPNIRALHERMPILVDPPGYEAWLDPSARDVNAVLAKLAATRGAQLTHRRVSTRVNDVHNDDARCLDEAEQGALF
ncbi:MAG: SOS response-associated peptidase [Deltaproteobacteria bacterium]|nr:SOS response-associated peptidase [Deltaproteobacteria bacterium]